MLHMLDTDTASYLLKGMLPAAEANLARLSSDEVCISAVTRAELLYGLARLPADHRHRATVGRFLTSVRTVPWGPVAADRYAELQHRLTIAGQKIGEFDTMIAAHALAEEATLVTNNTRHFSRVGDMLLLVNWAR